MPKFVEKEVKTFVQQWVCDECGKGHMDALPFHLDHVDNKTNPPTFKHECTECKHVGWNAMQFPKLVYRDVKRK